MAQALEFEREGHTTLRNLISGAALKRLAQAAQSEYDHRANEAYAEKLAELGVSRVAVAKFGGPKEALSWTCRERGIPMPSLQVYNLHRADRPASKTVHDFVTSTEMVG